jgi:hypothetical protein
MNPKKLKKQTTLHSLKGLGGLKPPLEQVQGDSKLYKPTLAFTGETQGGTKSGRREAWNLPPLATQTQVFSPSFRRSPARERERERERERLRKKSFLQWVQTFYF